jgi:predicted RND superfamily exporter protein
MVGTGPRLRKTLKDAGLAVMMTSLTDVAALAAGTLSDLGAIRSFCAFASICVAVDFLLQARVVAILPGLPFHTFGDCVLAPLWVPL